MKNQSITAFVKLMDRGMMVIPQKMREKIGLEKGGYVIATLKDDEIVLKPYVDSTVGSVEKKSRLHITKSTISKEEGLKILSEQTKRPLWTKVDDDFYQQGRDLIEKRLREYDAL